MLYVLEIIKKKKKIPIYSPSLIDNVMESRIICSVAKSKTQTVFLRFLGNDEKSIELKANYLDKVIGFPRTMINRRIRQNGAPV